MRLSLLRPAGSRCVAAAVLLFVSGCSAGAPGLPPPSSDSAPFRLIEASISDIHGAYRSKQLTARRLVELYLARIDAYDKNGPYINSIITINRGALEDADRLDEAFASAGLVGPLHGIPIVLKDQFDAEGMPTTLGSVLFKNYQPGRDAFVTRKLKDAGAIILGKATLGELGGGDTHGCSHMRTSRAPITAVRQRPHQSSAANPDGALKIRS